MEEGIEDGRITWRERMVSLQEGIEDVKGKGKGRGRGRVVSRRVLLQPIGRVGILGQ